MNTISVVRGTLQRHGLLTPPATRGYTPTHTHTWARFWCGWEISHFRKSDCNKRYFLQPPPAKAPVQPPVRAGCVENMQTAVCCIPTNSDNLLPVHIPQPIGTESLRIVR
ncbi:hydrogenase expression/formation protein HypE [Anopheles sinensis]|uniref:Hydrogenase expression/formation protein HypE n=1 Tax=Anopheles sinensis TaxID=74873 RepID=A0A084VSZ2_ANOSI|nr:hydrogenase expression/formation protein HypE [Anopheles sinensis]